MAKDFDWSGIIQSFIVAVPALLAWRDAHRAHIASKDNTEKLEKVVKLVNGQQTILNDASQTAQRVAGVAEGALAELKAERSAKEIK